MSVRDTGEAAVASGVVAPGARPARLASLDVFRGLVIVLMFLVNVAGTDPAFPSWFPHRGWNEGRMGNGLADYVFPWFLFIVGVAVPFSMAAGRGRGLPAWRRALAALRRGVTIYLLGTLLWCATIGYDRAITSTAFLHWDILPLIGFGYVVGAWLALGPVWVRVVFLVAAMVLKVWLLRVGGHPLAAEVVPGVAWDQGSTEQAWVNARWGWWWVMVTQGVAAASVVVLGTFAGDVLRVARASVERRSAWLVVGGAIMAALSYAWHRGGAGIGMPYSKDLLSASYVLVTAGTGAMLLGALHLLVDGRGVRLAWLRVFGVNAIAVYVLAELVWKMVLMRWKLATPSGDGSAAIVAAKAWLQAGLGATAGSWALVAGYIGVYWLVCRALDRRGIYVKV